jgi:hypothetical protein
MSKPTYTPPIGGLSTNRYDFQTHIEGLSFRHSADQIDVVPPVIINGLPYVTVADALTATSLSISQLISNGEGFVTIGDGYDSWHNANGTINFDPTVPSLDTILNPIFNAIYTNTALPTQYQRIVRGGIVVIKAGTYYVVNTINVPPGIIILGEGYGTKIVNATSLVIPATSGSPPYPKVTSTSAPVFKILPDINRINNDGAINSNIPYFMFERVTKIMNLVIGDNFIEPTILGDLNYKLAQNYTANNPLILQEPGSHLECDHVVFVGRVNFATGQTVGTNGITAYPVQLDPANPISTGTILKVKDCFIDGFAIAGEFRGTGYNADVCEYINNKIRVYGYLGNDSASVIHNCILSTTPCNIEFDNNYIIGNGNNIKYGVYVDINGMSAPSSKNLMPRAEIIGNSGVVNNNATYANVSNNLSVSIFGTNESTPQTIILATIANNTFGSDSSNQRTIVPNTVALQQLDDTSMAAGSVVWVISNEEHYYLDRGTNAAGLSVDGINIFATASGNGKWIRLLYLNYGNAQINGNLTVNGTISGTISGGSSQPGNFSVGGNLSLTGSLIPTTGTLTVSGSQNIADNLSVTGTTSLSSLSVAGTTTLNTAAVAVTPVGTGITYTTTNQLTFTSVGAGRTTLTYIPSTGATGSNTIYRNNHTGAYEIASNCYWGQISGSSGWTSYSDTHSSSLITFDQSNGIQLFTQSVPLTSTWTDVIPNASGGWSNYFKIGVTTTNIPRIQIGGQSGGLNLHSASSLPNSVYADNITKAWASIYTAGAPASGDWFGVSSITYVGGVGMPISVTLDYIMDDANYTIICSSTGPFVTSIQNITNSSFDIYAEDLGQDAQDFDAFSDAILFVVYGWIGG